MHNTVIPAYIPLFEYLQTFFEAFFIFLCLSASRNWLISWSIIVQNIDSIHGCIMIPPCLSEMTGSFSTKRRNPYDPVQSGGYGHDGSALPIHASDPESKA